MSRARRRRRSRRLRRRILLGLLLPLVLVAGLLTPNWLGFSEAEPAGLRPPRPRAPSFALGHTAYPPTRDWNSEVTRYLMRVAAPRPRSARVPRPPAPPEASAPAPPPALLALPRYEPAEVRRELIEPVFVRADVRFGRFEPPPTPWWLYMRNPPLPVSPEAALAGGGGEDDDSDSEDGTPVVPEPGTLVLVLAGLAGLTRAGRSAPLRRAGTSRLGA